MAGAKKVPGETLDKLITPKGSALWPYIHTPTLKYESDDEYEYRCTIRVPEADAAPLIDKLSSLLDGWVDKVKGEVGARKAKVAENGHPWEEEYGDDDEPTGHILFKSKQAAQVTSKKNGQVYKFTVDMFDSSAKPCNVEVGMNSLVRLSVEVRGWFNPSSGCGISLQLKGCQILKLEPFNSGQSGSAESHGFGAEDDGFVSEFADETRGGSDNGEDEEDY